MGDTNGTRAPRLPEGAPQGLRDFVTCRRMSVELDTSDSSWLPKPAGLPDGVEPSVELQPGADGRSGTVSVGWGFVRISLPVRIVDGRLVVDAGDLPFGIGPEIDRWVDRLNDTLTANDKALDRFEVDGDRLTVTKRAVTAGAEAAATTAAVTTAGAATTATDEPAPEPEDRSKRSGCAAWILGGVAALAAAIGITWGVTSGGDDEAVGDPDAVPETTAVDPTTTSTLAAATTTVEVALGPAEEPTDCSSGPVPELPVGEYAQLPEPCGDVELVGYEYVCPPGPLCYDGTFPPLIVTGPPGVSHQGSRPDAVTGEVGPSEAVHPLWIGPNEVVSTGWEFEFVAQCVDTTVTGRAPVVPGEVTLVPHPLFSYGVCDATSARLLDETGASVVDVPPGLFGDGGTYEIGPTESSPGEPVTSRFATWDRRWLLGAPDGEPASLYDWTWADDAVTSRNVLAAAPIPDECLWFLPPDDLDLVGQIVDRCADAGQYWVFAAGLTDVEVALSVDDVVLGHGGSHVNPVGTQSGFADGFDTSGPLFDDSLFPCGPGLLAFTVCPDERGPMDAAGFVSVAIATAGDVPLAPDGVDRSHEIDFGPVGGGSYRIAQNADGWSLSGPDGTRARALVFGSSITLVVPDTELSGDPGLRYVLRSEVDGQVIEQPEVPVLGLATTPQVPLDEPETTTTTATTTVTTSTTSTTPDTGGDMVDAATVADFYGRLSTGLSTGDLTFPLDRLHPLVTAAYPDACPAALESFVDPDFSIELVDLPGAAPWTWDLPDGRSFDVPDAITTVVRVSGRGQTGEPSEAHLAVVDGDLRWFTFCD